MYGDMLIMGSRLNLEQTGSAGRKGSDNNMAWSKEMRSSRRARSRGAMPGEFRVSMMEEGM